MAFENPLMTKSLIAAADLSAKQFCAVKLNGSGKMVICGAGEASIGPLQNAPTANQAGTYMDDGISRIMSGAAYSEMDALAADANGKYVKATPGTIPIAIALEAATGADQVCTGRIIPGAGAQGGAPFLSLSNGAENAPGANQYLISAQLKNPNGTNVAVATTYRATSFDAGAVFTDGGAGTISVGSGTVDIVGVTSAAGLAEVLLTDAAAETVVVMFQPERGVPTFLSLVFT